MKIRKSEDNKNIEKSLPIKEITDLYK